MVKMLNYGQASKRIIGAFLGIFTIFTDFSNNCKYAKVSAKEDKDIMDKIGNPDISDSLKQEIRYISNNKVALGIYLTLAKRSERYVRWTMYYMTHQDAKKINMAKEDREFVNSLAYYAGFGKIYECDEAKDLRKYDVAQSYGVFNAPHMILFSDIRERFSDPDFKALWQANIAAKSIIDINTKRITTSQVDDQGFIHPAFTIVDGTEPPSIVMPKQPASMDNETFKLFESVFGKIIGNREYNYSMDDMGNWCITATEGIVMQTYLIDDGSIMGGRKVSILGRYMRLDGFTDTVFVDVNKHPAIAGKILTVPFYVMAPDEVSAVFRDMYQNCFIYRFIDFSNTGDIYDKVSLTENGDNIFGRYLDGVVKILGLEHVDCRLRFAEFKSIHSFTLVSDDKCKTTLNANSMSPNILSGFKIRIADKKAYVMMGKEVKKVYDINFVK
jgi:hypothetical protein